MAPTAYGSSLFCREVAVTMYGQQFWMCVNHPCYQSSGGTGCTCATGTVSYVAGMYSAQTCDANCSGAGGCEVRSTFAPSAAPSAAPTVAAHDFRYPAGGAPAESKFELEALAFPTPGDQTGANKHLDTAWELYRWGKVWLDALDEKRAPIRVRVNLFEFVVNWPDHPVPRHRLYLGYEFKTSQAPAGASDSRVYSVEQIRDDSGQLVPGFYVVRTKRGNEEKAFVVRTEHDLVEK